MSRWVTVKRGKGPRAGSIQRHVTDPNRLRVRVFIGRDADGRQRYRSKVVYGGTRDAEAALLEMLQQKSTGSLTPRSTMTLADLAREWADHKARSVTPRTLADYVDALDRYVLPSLGRRKLADLHLRDIDRLYGMMLAGELPRPNGERGITGRPLGPRTVRLTHAVLRQALSQAVRWGLIQHNPASEATIPADRPKAKETLTAAEVARFFDACNASFYGAFYRALIDTGMRPGEACALRWPDVDFARGTITVQHAVTKNGKDKPIPDGPKNRTSRRTIPMLAGLRDVLLTHMAWQRERGLDGDFVFTNQVGDTLRPWTFYTGDLRRTLAAAAITKPISLYSLRHTFATLHVAAGTPIKVVSDLLGHASIQQTANTYMHGDQAVTSEWMQRFEHARDQAAEAARTPVN
jgi:integrase